MNNKTTNPFLKQMIAEIARKTEQGRINWPLNEAKKKKTLKKEVAKRPPQEDPNAGVEDENPNQPPSPEAPSPEAAPDAGNEVPPDSGAGLPDLGAEPGQEDPAAAAGDLGGDMPPSEPAGEDPEAAQADAEDAKAKVDQATAEKDQAEKELEDQAYIKLNSHSGTQFLLSKLLDHAFKTNTIDALAGEMVGKLKVDTPEDMTAFVEELAPFMIIPGMAQLISSMKGLATKQAPAGNPPESPDETPEA
jgi:hypothetical protein